MLTAVLASQLAGVVGLRRRLRRDRAGARARQRRAAAASASSHSSRTRRRRSSTTRSSPTSRRPQEGKGTEFKTSFGASGDQSRAVEAGQKADVVSFSVEPDMTRLVKAGLVADDWNAGPNKGLVTTSVVTFVVRKGNPKNIKTWDDLLKPGVKVLTPNPFTSGAAKWNLLAAYGQAADGGKDPEAGLDYVRKLLTEHVKVQDKSGREALQNFTSGDADVLLSYEYEATTANKKGEDLDYVIPDDTIKIDIDIATTKDAPEQAKHVPRLRPVGARRRSASRAGATGR